MKQQQSHAHHVGCWQPSRAIHGRLQAKKRAGKPRASVDERMEVGVKGVADRLMDEYLRYEGLAPDSS
jgi:hypothetical protein